MAYTQAEWSRLQSKLPPDERQSYASYLAQQTGTMVDRAKESGAAKTTLVTPIAAPLDDRQQAIAQKRGISAQLPTETKTPSAGGTVGTGDPFAGETGWVNESFGWTADNRLIQRIVGNSGKILGYVYADTGEKADPSVIVPGKIVQQPTTTASQAATADAQKGLSYEQRSAKASLEAWLKTFFDPTKDAKTISDLMNFIDQQVTSDMPQDAIMINIRTQPFYQERFRGNEGLRKAGMAELDPAQYLQAEKTYADVLMAANLGNLSRRDVFANLIGGQVSAVELQDRVVNVYDRIKNADQALKDEMKRLNQLGNITAADYAEALLTGKEGAASLKRKIAQAEISTEFTTRGMASATGIEELANLGVSRQQAAQGAEYTKYGTKRLQDLATIYGVQGAGIQSELEAEAFKGLESQRRKQLVAQEQAAFAGSSGTGTISLGRSAAGAI